MSSALLLLLRQTWASTGVESIAMASFGAHACVIGTEETASRFKCFGSNSRGQLGYEDSNSRGDQDGEMGYDLDFINLGLGRHAVQATAGLSHTCVLLDNQQVKCFGNNDEGQLGYGDTQTRGNSDGDMGNLDFVDFGTGRTVVQIEAGNSHTCALLDNGRMKCFGLNADGQLGLGDNTNRGNLEFQMGDNLSFVDLGENLTVTEISLGATHTCALLDNQQVKCFGDNQVIQLGRPGGDLGTDPSHMGDDLPFVSLGNVNVTNIKSGQFGNCVSIDVGQSF